MLHNKKLLKVIGLSLVLSSFLHANETENVLEEINVIEGSSQERRKNSEEMFLKPYSKQVVGKKTIEEEVIPDIAEAIKSLPGISVVESSSFFKEIKIRGFSGARVVTLIDGMKLGNQGMTPTGAGETGTQEIENVEKIEVVKGSPSVIYAPGASGGIINIKTKKALKEKGISFKQKLSYDEGYDRKKSTTVLEGSTGKVSGRLSYSRSKAEDYKVSGQKDVKFVVEKANFLNPIINNNSLEIKDLGHDTRSLSLDLSAKVGEDSRVDLKWNDWLGEDMNLIYGKTLSNATVIQYDKIERDSKLISYTKKALGSFSDIKVQVGQDEQFQLIGKNGPGVELNAKHFNVVSDYKTENALFKIGAEARIDDARTAVYAEEDYLATFVNGEYVIGNFTLFGGVRYNRWTTEQRLLEGTDPVVASQLVGISGITPDVTKSRPTMAIGAQYFINDNNNLSLNLNTTYRNPNLMEKYAFSGILGGGLELQPEEGRHAELSWKYLDGNNAMTFGTYYSKFKNFINAKQHREIKDKVALDKCVTDGLCDPANGDYNNNETLFFDIYSKYYNVGDNVTKWGMEFDYKYYNKVHEVIFSSSFTKIKSDDVFAQTEAYPIDTNLSYRYQFQNSWNPWVKVNLNYVTDYPKVEQYGGFDPYFLTNLHAGFNKKGISLNAGIRNLFDKEYKAPYAGIDGLSRSFFVNLSYKY